MVESIIFDISYSTAVYSLDLLLLFFWATVLSNGISYYKDVSRKLKEQSFASGEQNPYIALFQNRRNHYSILSVSTLKAVMYVMYTFIFFNAFMIIYYSFIFEAAM